MATNPMFTLFDATARESEKFCRAFFQEIDARRAPPSISEGTTIVWNGTPLAGAQTFQEMVTQSPNMSHEVTCLDVHPFPNGDAHALNMIVCTSGKVKLGLTDKENNFAFSAQLVVRRPHAQAPLLLQTMSYRLVHQPTTTTIQF